ncbi:hypothetical protein ACS0TY_015453 [Phlomoides rotata]
MTTNGYHNGSLALASYGARWRVLRWLCTAEMFVRKQINMTTSIQRKCVEDMVEWIEKDGFGGNCILLGKYVFLAAFNMLGNLVDPELEKGVEFYSAMNMVMEWSGRANVSDLFSWIGWIDL